MCFSTAPPPSFFYLYCCFALTLAVTTCSYFILALLWRNVFDFRYTISPFPYVALELNRFPSIKVTEKCILCILSVVHITVHCGKFYLICETQIILKGDLTGGIYLIYGWQILKQSFDFFFSQKLLLWTSRQTSSCWWSSSASLKRSFSPKQPTPFLEWEEGRLLAKGWDKFYYFWLQLRCHW